MKKAVLFLFGLASIEFNAQTNKILEKKLADENIANQKKLEQILSSKKGKLSIEQISEMKKNLAGFAGNIPLFYQTDDMRANISANVTGLQDGSLTGNLINGDGINILVMDGGRVFDKHREFGADATGNVAVPRIFDKEYGTTSYANHPTNVAGIIGAIGYGSFGSPYGASAAKGVLPKVNIDSYSFYNTTQGTNYQKLKAADANISNHSYGINLGWNYVTSTNATYPQVGFYWVANYELNHQDTWSGSYGSSDVSFDAIVYNNPNQIVVKSAGNYFGTHPSNDNTKPKFKFNNFTNSYVPFTASDEIPPANCSQGYYCIGWGSLAKNIIVVGAADQLTTADYKYSNPSNVLKSSYSSAGPRRDGAIKPDISAVGTDMLVAGYNSDAAYTTYYAGAGTSYSAPVISGIAGAVTHLNRILTGNSSFTYKADEMKALLTHTANEAGNPGPDVWYGWGFADATKAAQLVIDKKDKKAYFERNLLNSGVKFTKQVTAKAGEPLKATISWVDPAGTPFTSDYDLQNNHSSMIVNDLDLRIIDTTNNTVYYPWKLDINNPMANATKGDNLVDNVEQVLLETPVAGRTYRIEVSNKGTLVDDGDPVRNPAPQNYALIITGVEASSLSTSNSTLDELVTVYPSRTKDILNVLIPKSGKSIEIYDLSGKSVLKENAKTYQTIDVSNLEKGVYIINIKTDKETISKKFIKE